MKKFVCISTELNSEWNYDLEPEKDDSNFGVQFYKLS